jgi:hypothetical protein
MKFFGALCILIAGQCFFVQGNSLAASEDNEVISQGVEWHNSLFAGCKGFYDELKNNDRLNSSEVFTLGLQMKTAMEINKLSLKTLTNFESLKKKLPKVVQKIIWNEETSLMNKGFEGESLIASSDNLAYDSLRRHVFLKATQENLEKAQAAWKFSTFDGGKTFLIKNVLHDEYLYPAYENFALDAQRRRIFTWREKSADSDCFWKVQIVSDTEVMLLSHKVDEYLYAETNEFSYATYRSVFSWRPNHICDDTCVWKLE